MKTVEVRVPDIGDFRDVEVIELMVGEGDRIARDQSLVLVESDKASMEIPSPQAGIVREMKAKLGDRISEGSLLLLLDVDDADSAEIDTGNVQDAGKSTVAALPSQNQAVPTVSAVSQDNGIPHDVSDAKNAYQQGTAPHASPSVRKYARELGVQPARLLLHRLGGFPGAQRLFGRGRLFAAEDVGVAADQLMHQLGEHVRPGELARALGDVHVEHRLQQQVARFLAQIVHVAAVYRLAQLVRLFHRVDAYGRVRLRLVPGAAVLRGQTLHDVHEVAHGVPRFEQAVVPGYGQLALADVEVLAVQVAQARLDRARVLFRYAFYLSSSISYSKNKEEAWAFIEYLLSNDVQNEIADLGSPAGVPAVKSVANSDRYLNSTAQHTAKNKAVLLEASEYALYGDWGYLETDMWINQWQGRLNEAGGVRDGKTTLDDFFKEVTGRTNNALASLYARKIGD